MKPPILIPQAEVLAWLALTHPELECEIERAWVWITSDLKPLHRKCECEACAERAVIRKSIMAYGFMFAKADHEFTNGKTARWSHHCQRPTRFIKKRPEANKDDADKDLLAALLSV